MTDARLPRFISELTLDRWGAFVRGAAPDGARGSSIDGRPAVAALAGARLLRLGDPVANAYLTALYRVWFEAWTQDNRWFILALLMREPGREPKRLYMPGRGDYDNQFVSLLDTIALNDSLRPVFESAVERDRAARERVAGSQPHSLDEILALGRPDDVLMATVWSLADPVLRGVLRQARAHDREHHDNGIYRAAYNQIGRRWPDIDDRLCYYVLITAFWRLSVAQINV